MRSVFVGAVALGLSLSLPPVTSFAQGTGSGGQWSGFSVSVGGGAAQFDSDLSAATTARDNVNLDILGIFIIDVTVQAVGQSGVTTDEWNGFGTLQGAYDFRFGNVIVGGLADFDFYPDKPGASSTQSLDGALTIDLNGATIVGPVPIPNFASVTSNIELQNVWSVGGRLGYLVTPDTLIYGLGGYTQARVEGDIQLAYTSFIFGPQALSLRAPDELRGYFVGAGGEVKVAQNLALRLEYRYANYSGETSSAAAGTNLDFNFGGSSVSLSTNGSVQADIDAQIHSVRGALVFKLGEP